MSYSQEMAGYRRVRNPDMGKMGELLEKMKGGRSYTQYAKDVGAAASSLTRIVNGEANKVSEKLLAGLLDNMAPDCGVTFEEVMDANGMAKDVRLSFRQGVGRSYTMAKEIISYELFRNGKSAVLVDDTMSYKRGFGRLRLDLLIDTDAVNKDRALWGFTFVNQFDGGLIRNSPQMPWPRIQDILSGIMSEFYVGSDIKKWSIVMNNREAFERVYRRIDEKFAGRAINDLISLILINEERRYVENELYLPTRAEVDWGFPLKPEESDKCGSYDEEQ